MEFYSITASYGGNYVRLGLLFDTYLAFAAFLATRDILESALQIRNLPEKSWGLFGGN
jgi:hypothetical protein